MYWKLMLTGFAIAVVAGIVLPLLFSDISEELVGIIAGWGALLAVISMGFDKIIEKMK